MAAKKKKGPVVDMHLAALHGIRADLGGIHGQLAVIHGEMTGLHTEMAGVRSEVRETNERLGGVETKLEVLASVTFAVIDHVDRLESASIRGFTGVTERLDVSNARLEGLRDVAGTAVRAHDDRLDALEDRVAVLEGKRS